MSCRAGSTMLQGGSGSTKSQAGQGSSRILKIPSLPDILAPTTNANPIYTLLTEDEALSEAERFTFRGVNNILFLLDASQSMKEKLKRDSDGNKIRKIDKTKEIVTAAVKQLPKRVNCGLRTFGENAPSGRECLDTKLAVPVGNRKELTLRHLRDIVPKGASPLVYAVRQTLEDISELDGRTIVVLIADGEDTCGENTVEFLRSRMPLPVRFAVIDLSIGRDGGANAMNTIAKLSSGRYYKTDRLLSFMEDFMAIQTKELRAKDMQSAD